MSHFDPVATPLAGAAIDWRAGPSGGYDQGMHPRDVATTVLVTAVWGVAFVGIKEVTAHGAPLTLAGLRFVLGGALLLPLARRGPGPAAAERRVRPLSGREAVLVALLQTFRARVRPGGNRA